MQSEDEKLHKPILKRKFQWTISNTVIILLILLLLCAILIPTARYYLNVGESRDVLRTAKNIQLASRAVAYEFKAKDDSMLDTSRPQGITSEAEKRILELMGADGEIRRVEFNESTFQVEKLIYVESGYCAIYENSGDKPAWTVYKISKMVDF